MVIFLLSFANSFYELKFIISDAEQGGEKFFAAHDFLKLMTLKFMTSKIYVFFKLKCANVIQATMSRKAKIFGFL